MKIPLDAILLIKQVFSFLSPPMQECIIMEQKRRITSVSHLILSSPYSAICANKMLPVHGWKLAATACFVYIVSQCPCLLICQSILFIASYVIHSWRVKEHFWHTHKDLFFLPGTMYECTKGRRIVISVRGSLVQAKDKSASATNWW